jgi:ribonuclease BN (tRNA processing enzyme)
MEEQKTEESNWLQKEAEETKNTAFDEDRSPALKLEENKITEITVDFSIPFEKWEDEENHTVKKIIPVTSKGEKFVWWLNVKNPVYGQIVNKGLEGQTVFKVLQTGNKQNTKYTLVE